MGLKNLVSSYLNFERIVLKVHSTSLKTCLRFDIFKCFCLIHETRAGVRFPDRENTWHPWRAFGINAQILTGLNSQINFIKYLTACAVLL